MGDEINKVIDNLCEKFGTTYSMLIPEITKYGIVKSSILCAISIAVLCLGIWIMRYAMKNKEKDPCGDDEVFAIPALIVLIIGNVVLFVGAGSLIGWLCAPNIKAIEYIADLVQ